MAKERIDTYPEAARAIALWLDEFCDKSLRYPEMIADAARKAAREIEFLRCDISQQPNAADGSDAEPNPFFLDGDELARTEKAAKDGSRR